MAANNRQGMVNLGQIAEPPHSRGATFSTQRSRPLCRTWTQAWGFFKMFGPVERQHPCHRALPAQATSWRSRGRGPRACPRRLRACVSAADPRLQAARRAPGVITTSIPIVSVMAGRTLILKEG